MGVPGLWRILDLASQPLDLEKCSGLTIAIDINSHANRLVHSTSASNWIYILARDFFRILHFNIRFVVVFMGRRPVEKIYSTALGDENEDSTYYRVRSLILRSNKDSPTRNAKKEETSEQKPSDEVSSIPKLKITPRPKISSHLEEAKDINEVSKFQINSVIQSNPIPAQHLIHHSNFTNSYIFFDKTQQPSLPSTSQSSTGNPPKELQLPTAADASVSSFYSSFLDSIKDIISEDDPLSEGNQIPEQPEEPDANLCPVSLLPDENSYLPPIENFLTATHLRLMKKLCDVLNIPYIEAPEEACAECARLEREGIVDATASDDNNSILFGTKWMIRGIFTKPQSITLKTMDNVGLCRERLLMIAMMIDGDYNMDIRRRLFTVGPVRGMEILSLFPDVNSGLDQFKNWWIKVVKNKQKEKNPRLARLARMKWIKKLIMPESFPPTDLLDAFRNPVVGESKPVIKLPNFDPEEVIKFVHKSSSIREERIRENTLNFTKRIELFRNDKNRHLISYTVNELKESATFQLFIDRIIEYDKSHKKVTDKAENDDDEWDTVSATESDDDGNEKKKSASDKNDGLTDKEEEDDKDSIENNEEEEDDKDSIEDKEEEEDDQDSIEEA